MNKYMKAVIGNGFSPHWLIDTGRNGVSNERTDCSNWCNIRGAGIGHRPTTKTALPDIVDAYFWLKTPGECDGCTQTLPSGGTCARYDTMCDSADSIGSRSSEPRAPEAGKWFDYEIKQLAANANLGPTNSPPPSPSPSPSPSPLSCPGGTMAACIGLCSSVNYTTCVTACAHNCPSGTAVEVAVSVPAHAKPFSPCTVGGVACTSGYVCQVDASMCMPTAAKRKEVMHNAVFRTAYEHAVKRIKARGLVVH